jgi:TonB family protein
LAVTACSLTAMGQQQPFPGESRRAPVIVDVKPSPYPQLAFAAHVSGVVELDLAVRHDGTLQSADVISGPAMLRQAALGAVQQARFECHGCGEAPTQTHVAVQYTLGEVRPCPATEESSTAFIEKESYLQVTHSDDAISITDRPIGTCDYAATISKSSARSVKCLFLWHCGWRYFPELLTSNRFQSD